MSDPSSMPPAPLPQDQAALQALFHRCEACLRHAERARYRNIRLSKLFVAYGDGEVSWNDLQASMAQVRANSERDKDDFIPSPNELWQYCDDEVLAHITLLGQVGSKSVEQPADWVRTPLDAELWAASVVAWLTAQRLRTFLLSDLKQRITADLERIARDQLASKVGLDSGQSREQPEPPKPVWDNRLNRLMFQGQVARQVRGKTTAGRLHAILDAFQSAEWPEWVAAPRSFDPEALRDALKTLR